MANRRRAPNSFFSLNPRLIQQTIGYMRPPDHFLQRIEDVDDELRSDGVPIRYRPLDCFKRLYGTMPEGPERQRLFDQISDWFIEKYGDGIRWDGVITRFPVLIKGKIYLARVCFTAGGENLKRFQDDLEELPENVLQSLRKEETRLIIEKLIFGNRSFGNLYNLRIEDDFLTLPEQQFVRRAFYDLENAAMTLKHTGDTQTAVFQSHQAAEKFLKAALSRVGSVKSPESFRHNIPRLLNELQQLDKSYDCLSLPVENLQRLAPNMNLRYLNVSHSLKMASEAFHGALYLCGMMAEMWLFEKERGGAKSDFRPYSFYVDGGGLAFFCKSIEGDSVILTLFRSSEYTGTQMADITLKADQSALYLEVTDPPRVTHLRMLYDAVLRNRGGKVSPEEFGLKIVHGPEGSFTTGVLKLRIPTKG